MVAPHMFLRNEPNFLEAGFRWKWQGESGLEMKNVEKGIGFVFENEPNFRGF